MCLRRPEARVLRHPGDDNEKLIQQRFREREMKIFNFWVQRTSIKSNEKRPSSVSWMVTNPRGHCSRPGTPTAGYPLDTCAISSAVAAAASLVAATASSGAQQVRQMSDDFAADLVVEPSYLYNSSKVRQDEAKFRIFFPAVLLDRFKMSKIALVPLFHA
jgi:hypothetical protein